MAASTPAPEPPRDYVGFWSYAHADDESDRGRLLQLSQDIQSEYELLTGTSITIFVDRDSVEWGEIWRQKIEDILARTLFFIAVGTPRYLRSEECRHELLRFYSLAKSTGLTALVLPLLYVDIPELQDKGSTDEVVTIFQNHQREDWTTVRLRDPSSEAYRQAVNKLALRLMKIAETTSSLATEPGALPVRSTEPATESSTAVEPHTEPKIEEGNEPSGELGIIELLAAMEEALPRWLATAQEIGHVVEEIGSIMQRGTDALTASDAAGKGFAGRLRVSREIAQELNEPASRLESLSLGYGSVLTDVDGGVVTIIRLAEEGLDEENMTEVCKFFGHVRELARGYDEAMTNMTEFTSRLQGLVRFSRELRSPIERIAVALRPLLDGQAVIEDWIRRLDEGTVDCG